jgi:4-methyl-5(b-hydroxyethyl)-thiazole monophosphate biosynthesis
MPKVLVPLAEGCEELEAVTVIDILRRAGVEVTVAGLAPGPVRASRGTVLVPDVDLDAVKDETWDMVVLPGGLPGADHLENDPRILDLLRRQAGEDRHLAAICAAPKVLARAGLLQDREATAFPGVLEALEGAGVRLRSDPVVADGKIVTSRGPGTALDFALHLVELLRGRGTRDAVEAKLQRP